MIPLTFLAISWIFNPSAVDFSWLWHFRHTDGTGFFSPLFGHGWLTLYIAFSFLLTWNVIAMEAAACYIGETKNPDRDAKIAMNLEGLYGLFIYTMIPVAFIIVLGCPALGNAALVDPKTIFVHYAAAVFGTGTGSSILEWLIAIMLILALILSALNAITGTARSLHQMSTDGQFPRFFQRVNNHGVPNRAMWFNVAARSRSCSWGRGRDLHVLERRLPGLVHPGADRLLPVAQAPPERPPAVQVAGVDEVRRPVHRGGVRGHLLLRRPRVRKLHVQRRWDARRCRTTSSAGRCSCPTCGSSTTGSGSRTNGRRRRRRRSLVPGTRPDRGRVRPVSATARLTKQQEPGSPIRGAVRADPAGVRGSAVLRRRDRAGPSTLPRPRMPASACSRSPGYTASRSGCRCPGCFRPRRSGRSSATSSTKPVRRLERKGIEADGHVVGTRKTTQRIFQEAKLAGCDAIVMAADPDRNRVVGDFDAVPGAPAGPPQGEEDPGVPGLRRRLARRVRPPAARGAAPA